MSEDVSPRLPVFNGSQRVIIPELWMRKFEDFCHLMQWSDDEAVRQFRQHLSGSAECWYHSLQEEDTESFNTLKRLFMENFYRINIDPVGLKGDLESRKQAPDETVEDYLHQKLIYVLQSDMIQSPEAIDLVYNGFLPAIRDLINIQHIRSLEALQRSARKQYVRISRRTGCSLRRPERNALEFGSIIGVADGTVGTANTAATVNGGMGNTNVHLNMYQATTEDRGEIVISCLRALNRGEDIANLMNEFGEARNTNSMRPEPARTPQTHLLYTSHHPSLVMEEPVTGESHNLSRHTDDSSGTEMSMDPAQCTVKHRISDNSFVAHPEDDTSASLAGSHEILSQSITDLAPYKDTTGRKVSKCHVTHPEEDTSAEVSLEIYSEKMKATSIHSARYTRISGNWLRTHPVEDQVSLYTIPLSQSVKDVTDLSQSVVDTTSMGHHSLAAHPEINNKIHSLIRTPHVCTEDTSDLPPPSVTFFSMRNKCFVGHSEGETVASFDRTEDILAEDTTFRKTVDSTSSISSQDDDHHGASLTYRKTFDTVNMQEGVNRPDPLYEPVTFMDTDFHSINGTDPGSVPEDASYCFVGLLDTPMSGHIRPEEKKDGFFMYDVDATSVNGPLSGTDLTMCLDSAADPTPCVITTTMQAHATQSNEYRGSGPNSQDGIYRLKFDINLTYAGKADTGNCIKPADLSNTESWDHVLPEESHSGGFHCRVSEVWEEIS
ncbi:uncharacterized protein LOC124114030 isoform X1 [Haliotis rufescens]|uniref:uncharacterized protein LOC124114030 isoform X1 n=1 Tax=Haliotis rufescens TaxID=6454 RepID=UPI00201F786A|nr:uncharacterized protein LOC124114030 isoform X1 [Haliotis rufescens]